MRFPFNENGLSLNEESRVKFIFTSPELHQNVEVSLDGENTSVEALLEAFQRFLAALGICLPENFAIGFVNVDEAEEMSDGDADNIDDDDDDKGGSQNNKNNKNKKK
jgi:hypothetical protein